MYMALGPRNKDSSSRRELVLVLEGDLYLVPFPVLRSGTEGCDYLCERFSLLAVPSISALKSSSRANRKPKEAGDQNVTALVVGKHSCNTVENIKYLQVLSSVVPI